MESFFRSMKSGAIPCCKFREDDADFVVAAGATVITMHQILSERIENCVP